MSQSHVMMEGDCLTELFFLSCVPCGYAIYIFIGRFDLINMLCCVCMRANTVIYDVPDRTVGVWAVYLMCPLCMDEFLSLFPISVSDILHREIDGIAPPFRKRLRRGVCHVDECPLISQTGDSHVDERPIVPHGTDR